MIRVARITTGVLIAVAGVLCVSFLFAAIWVTHDGERWVASGFLCGVVCVALCGLHSYLCELPGGEGK